MDIPPEKETSMRNSPIRFHAGPLGPVVRKMNLVCVGEKKDFIFVRYKMLSLEKADMNAIYVS